ncbi:MAG: NADH-quinone oxidoreductase subunit G [Parasphingorhabdus sp.]|jgi:NADH-quinone oxidoreductase subunit G
MATIEIDGKQIEVADGTMLIKAADAAGIYIPRFCYHEKLSIAANCRMCMVDIERAPKPMPACATPVMDGMKVSTNSERAVEAQKGTMEFLLINHPLDCPICDQGGECPLQDQALGYGKDISRFTEKKRVVEDKDIGPLIETSMTRCIHCTRCVRFGEEVAGAMELGAVGRGEHTKIGTIDGQTVDSEVSGNMIDLCPVGALTSKPSRYSARPWELTNHDSVSPHDCLGSNLHVQTLRNEVKRVVPRDNYQVNDCWIADRDRFSYEAVNSEERLTQPLLKSGDHWEVTDWKTAFTKVLQGLDKVRKEHGDSSIGSLISPIASNEEMFLFQKLVRSIGCGNIDHRLRQIDFSDDEKSANFPGSSMPISKIDSCRSVLLVGSNIRKDQPLLGLRVRQAGLNGGQIYKINSLDYHFNFDTQGMGGVDPASIPGQLARVAECVAAIKQVTLPSGFASWAATVEDNAEQKQIADSLSAEAAEAVLVLGLEAAQHRRSSVLRQLSQWIAEQTGCALISLCEGNSAGAWLTGCVPHRGPHSGETDVTGTNAADMVANPRSAYILYGVDAELDACQGAVLCEALKKADFVVSFSAFHNEAMNDANVVLPITPFTEMAGSFVNLEGMSQKFNAAVTPKGEARPGWKVLRVLGNELGLSGFDYLEISDVQSEMGLVNHSHAPTTSAVYQLSEPDQDDHGAGADEFHRVMDVPLYRVDGLVRRSPALQSTRDNPLKPKAGMNPSQLEQFGLRNDTLMNIVTPEGVGISIKVEADDRVPVNCVYIPSGYKETATLGFTTRVMVEEV